jgi:hypothetical protein
VQFCWIKKIKGSIIMFIKWIRVLLFKCTCVVIAHKRVMKFAIFGTDEKKWEKSLQQKVNKTFKRGSKTGWNLSWIKTRSMYLIRNPHLMKILSFCKMMDLIITHSKEVLTNIYHFIDLYVHVLTFKRKNYYYN